MNVRDSHCVRHCNYGGCEQAYDVSNSDAERPSRYCSAECELLAAEEHAIAHEDRFGYYPTRGTA
jgi:hypothetical protein